MEDITVIVVLRLAADHRDEALSEVQEALRLSTEDAGATNLSLLHDWGDRNRIVLLEHWQSQALFDEHMSRPHMRSLGERGPVLFAGPPEVQVLHLAPGEEADGSSRD